MRRTQREARSGAWTTCRRERSGFGRRSNGLEYEPRLCVFHLVHQFRGLSYSVVRGVELSDLSAVAPHEVSAPPLSSVRDGSSARRQDQ